MDIERWERIQSLFHEAVAHPECERRPFLETACGDDSDLADEVLAMLAADGQSGSLLDRGLTDVAYQMVGASFRSVSLREVGPYRLKRVLGEGGMGVVWLAEREDAGNLVAIKFLPHAGLSPARRARFAREIKTLGKLKHPFIARLYDAGTLADGTPWFVMEYVEGLPFTGYCREHKLGVDERLRLFRSICEAVQYAHGQEIIHRDLKPSNILVEKDGTPRLLDFGIARELHSLSEPTDQTRAGLRFMSPDYAAPEWIHDGSVGFYTDVYSLGVILFEVLTGRLPSDRSRSTTDGEENSPVKNHSDKPSVAASRSAELPDAKERARVSKAAWNDLDVLCFKAIHKDPQERYQSVEALMRDLDHYLKGEPLDARPDSFPYRLGKFIRRNRRAVLGTSVALALVAGLIVFFTLRLAKARARADRETAIATAMNHFLADDLLGRSDPFKSGQAKEAFVDVVSQASPQIDLQFKDEPAVAARLHLTIAKAFDNRSDFPRARTEYERANGLFQQAEGPLSQDAVLVRLQRAAMEARSTEPGSLALAQSLLRDAETTISQTARPREDLAVWVFSTRGVIGIISNNAHAANDSFSAALRRAQAIPSFDRATLLQIKQMLAFSYIRLGDGAKAESLLRELIADYSNTLGQDSPNVLKARVNLSQALMIQDKFAEAVQEANLIYPALVAKLGEDHETTLGILSTRAASEGYLGMWVNAVRDDLAVYNFAVRKQGPLAFVSIATLSDAALSQCRAGQYAQGEPNARKAFQEATQAFGARGGLTGGCSYALAICLIGTGKLGEASQLLQNIDSKVVSQTSGDTTVDASIALARAEIALRRGDYLSAQRYVDAAAPMFDRPNAEAAQKQSLQKLKKAIDAHLRGSN